MKPEDLKPPFPKEQRRVVIHDRIWYVPRYFPGETPAFVFPGWDHPDFFGNSNPVNIEYCSGNGSWIAAKAAENPNINWVGIEIKFMRVRKIWSKIKNLKLNNLIVICGEGHNATSCYFPNASVNEIFINFPDPWPKSRHAKNRIIQVPFINEMARVLKTDGSMIFVTDDKPYSEWLLEKMNEAKMFSSTIPDPFYTTEWPEYGTSYFEDLWRTKGLSIRYHKFMKLP